MSSLNNTNIINHASDNKFGITDLFPFIKYSEKSYESKPKPTLGRKFKSKKNVKGKKVRRKRKIIKKKSLKKKKKAK